MSVVVMSKFGPLPQFSLQIFLYLLSHTKFRDPLMTPAVFVLYMCVDLREGRMNFLTEHLPTCSLKQFHENTITKHIYYQHTYNKVHENY